MYCIVIPAYNEAESIGRVIRDLFENGHRNVVVVDDGSGDDTAFAATSAGATVIAHAINRGQGAALQTGDEYALIHGAEAVVHFDADGQFDAADITPAIEFLRTNNLGAVLGSRFLRADNKIPFLKKYFVFPMSRLVNNWLIGKKLTDIHNGFRVFTNDALAQINITQNRMAHATEILRQLSDKKILLSEFPVRVTYHEYGQGIGGAVKIIKDLIVGFFTK